MAIQSVGFARNKSDIDYRAGTLAVQLRNLMTDIKRFAELMAQANDQYFLDMGYNQEEVDYLQSSFTALYELQQVYNGQKTVPTAKNYFQASQLLMGVQ